MDPQRHKQIWEAVQLHPLFQGLEQSTALSLVSDCEPRTYKKTEVIPPHQGLLVILSGMAEVFVEDVVLEILQKGELIGFSNLVEVMGGVKAPDTPSAIQVRAVEDLEALFVPFSVLSKRWTEPVVTEYLLSQVTARLKDVYGSLAEQVKLARKIGDKQTFMTRVQDLMVEKLVTVTPDASIQEVALNMFEHRTSSVLVMEGEVLTGIITERDIVHRVVAQGKNDQGRAREIMTASPITIPRLAYYYEAITSMLLNGIKHLPVTDKGGKTVLGIVTLSDLFQKKNASVMKIIKRIDEADETSLPFVKEAIYEITDMLLKEQVPAFSLLEVVTALYDRVVLRVVELAVANLGGAPTKFAFFQMGSSGRGEQFMLTDQDHFLVYEDGGDSVYFKKLGVEITRLFEVAGYARCQGLMMASEEQWRGSVSQWQERLRHWMLKSTNENLLLAQNFFSYRLVAGDESVAKKLDSMIAELLDRSKIFQFRLTQAERAQGQIPELDQPIRSLFKMDRKNIDLKKEVLFPYHHSLQILSVLEGIPGGTPVGKINALLQKGVFTADFAADLKAGVDQILSLYIRLRWAGGSSVLHFHSLSTREKDELILSLDTLRELQGMVFARFTV